MSEESVGLRGFGEDRAHEKGRAGNTALSSNCRSTRSNRRGIFCAFSGSSILPSP